MKIVVRNANPSHSDSFPERSLYSEASPLVINPLPPLPKNLDPHFFNGAVGRFTIASETRVAPFQKDEPISVRFVMQGEGNFPEINILEIPFPPQVEVLSRKALTQGAGQYSSKTFELSLAIHAQEGFILPPFPFIYFNPMIRQYEQVQLPEMRFEALPPPVKEKDADREPVLLPPPEAHWTAYRPVTHRLGFLALQALLGISLFGFAAARLAGIAARRRRQSPAYLRGVKAQQALEQYRSGNLEVFLRQASELALEILEERARPSKPLNKSQLLIALENKGQGEVVTRARALFEALDLWPIAPQRLSPRIPKAF